MLSTKNVSIERLVSDKYYLKKSIMIAVEVLDDGEYIACFEEAGISFSADTATQAVKELEVELIEVYELYKVEPHLGSWPRHQLTVLESYLGEKEQ